MKKQTKKTVKKSVKKSPNIQKVPAALKIKLLPKKSEVIRPLMVVELKKPSKALIKAYDSEAGPGWNSNLESQIGRQGVVVQVKILADGTPAYRVAPAGGGRPYVWLGESLKVVGMFEQVQLPSVRCENVKQLERTLELMLEACPYLRWKSGDPLTTENPQVRAMQFPVIVSPAGAIDIGVWTVDQNDPVEPSSIPTKVFDAIYGKTLAAIFGK